MGHPTTQRVWSNQCHDQIHLDDPFDVTSMVGRALALAAANLTVHVCIAARSEDKATLRRRR